MFSEELRNLLIQVITSWQVLAVTVVLVLYVFLINYVSRSYYRRRSRSPVAKVKTRVKSEPPKVPPPEESDDLGLEEEPLEE